MGSGKGQAKRIQTTSNKTSLLEVFRKNSKRVVYINDAAFFNILGNYDKFSNELIIDYYLGKDNNPNKLTKEEIEYILTEFMRDVFSNLASRERTAMTGLNRHNIIEEKVDDIIDYKITILESTTDPENREYWKVIFTNIKNNKTITISPFREQYYLLIINDIIISLGENID